MINIVLYFKNAYDADYIFNALVNLFTNSEIAHHKNIVTNDIHIYEGLCKPIFIDIRFGDVLKLGGLRPDFYYADTLEGQNFLTQSADKVNGIRLSTWYDVLKLVDCFREEENYD